MKSKEYNTWKKDIKKTYKKHMSATINLNSSNKRKKAKAQKDLKQLNGKIYCAIPFERFDSAGNDLYKYMVFDKYPNVQTGYNYKRKN